MANVSLTRTKYAVGGTASSSAADAVIIDGFFPTFGVTVGVYKGEADSVVVSLNSALSGTAGNANCGEPAYDGKDVFIPADALINAGKAMTVYVRATTGDVEYWVTAV